MEKPRHYLQNINLNREYFSLRFFTAGAILSIAFFLFFINTYKTYTSSITILVSAKSEVAAQQEKQIVGNIVEFPRTLAFYDRLLKFNPNVRDIAAGKSPAERKTTWDKMLSVKKIGRDSSLIKISISAGQKNDADQLVQKTARTLFDFAGLCYNIKNDVDLRIIDGPISYSRITMWPFMIMLSLVFGFLIAFILQYIISKGKDISAGGRNILRETTFFNFNPPAGGGSQASSEQEDLKSLEDLYMSDILADIPAISQENYDGALTPGIREMKKLTKTIEPSKYPNFSEVPKHAQVKAGAPANLPIADDSFFDQPHLDIEQKIIEQQPEAAAMEKEPETQIQNEPNAQQIKERLNKLLRGEL